ncbi:MAG: hypothetical protein RL139_894 [Gemmatimonadota bacterium]
MNERPLDFVHVVPGVGRFDRCPKAWLRDEAAAPSLIISDYNWLKLHGVMPRAGGLLDQDPRFVEGATIITEEIYRAQRRRAEQAPAQANMGARVVRR